MSNVYYGTTPYSPLPIYVYTNCPHCGGTLGGYPRLAHPHGHRWYSRCHGCNYGAWQWEQDREIRARIESGQYAVYVREAAEARERRVMS